MKFRFSGTLLIPFETLKSGIFIISIQFNPNRITIAPNTFSIYLILDVINVLAVVAKIASNTNTIEYPNTNPIAFLTVFDVLFSSLPAKYEIQTGSNGKIQGEIKPIGNFYLTSNVYEIFKKRITTNTLKDIEIDSDDEDDDEEEKKDKIIEMIAKD